MPELPNGDEAQLQIRETTNKNSQRMQIWKSKWFVGICSGAVGMALGATLVTAAGDSSEPKVATSKPGSSATEVVDEPTEAPVTLTNEGNSGGLALKLVSAKRKSSITYEGGTSSDTTPDGEAQTVKATDGGFYLYVKTEGRNGTKEPIDLTCGFPIDIAVFDADDAKYSPIESLAQIAGNPGCNDQVQPGQKFSETFIFLMPSGANPSQLAWASVNSDLDSAETAGIDLSSS